MFVVMFPLDHLVRCALCLWSCFLLIQLVGWTLCVVMFPLDTIGRLDYACGHVSS